MKFCCKLLFCLFLYGLVISCFSKRNKQYTPWGTEITDDDATDTLDVSDDVTLQDIQRNGEIIVVTQSGPNTYYEYHDRGMGKEFLLFEKYAQTLGIKVRVELCNDTSEIIRRILDCEADVALFADDSINNDKLKKVGHLSKITSLPWYCRSANKDIEESIKEWYKPSYIAEVEQQEKDMLSTKVVRHVYSPLMNKSGGVISRWDSYFKQAGATLRWDWRLIAAQCYQESCFDPKAKSWAGACGLMQIMPTTADHLDLPRSMLFDPVANITAATKYLVELNQMFNDVRDSRERMWFVLASYNGGPHHIRDAMSLAAKNGRNKYSWAEVSRFVLKLMEPQYYQDPVVKYGYMRGTETVDYVAKIRQRWQSYSGISSSAVATPFSFKKYSNKVNRGVHRPPVISNDFRTPREAKRKNRYAK